MSYPRANLIIQNACSIKNHTYSPVQIETWRKMAVWLRDFQLDLEQEEASFFLSAYLLNEVLSREQKMSNERMIACAYLASFYDDVSYPNVEDCVSVGPEGFSKEILNKELEQVIVVLEGRTRPVTVYDVIIGMYSSGTSTGIKNAVLLASLLCMYHPEVFSVSPDTFGEACVSLVRKLSDANPLNHLEKILLSRTLEIVKDAEKYLKNTDLHNLLNSWEGFRYNPKVESPKKLSIKEASPSNASHLKSLGTGTYGSVNLVERDSVQYARKTQTISQQSVVELSILASYKHDNLVAFDSFFIEQGDLYIDLEPGLSLHSLIAKLRRSLPGKGTFSWSDIYTKGIEVYPELPNKRKLQLDLMKGIKYLHDYGVLHRDLKPGNIIVVDGTAKLIDFGLCYVGCLSRTDKMLKTSHAFTKEYCPPEILKSKDSELTYSFEVDCWSLGAILLEMETLVSPFGHPYSQDRKESTLWCIQKVLNNPIFPVSDNNVRTTILDLLVEDPKSRIDVAAALRRLSRK